MRVDLPTEDWALILLSLEMQVQCLKKPLPPQEHTEKAAELAAKFTAVRSRIEEAGCRGRRP